VAPLQRPGFCHQLFCHDSQLGVGVLGARLEQIECGVRSLSYPCRFPSDRLVARSNVSNVALTQRRWLRCALSALSRSRLTPNRFRRCGSLRGLHSSAGSRNSKGRTRSCTAANGARQLSPWCAFLRASTDSSKFSIGRRRLSRWVVDVFTFKLTATALASRGLKTVGCGFGDMRRRRSSSAMRPSP